MLDIALARGQRTGYALWATKIDWAVEGENAGCSELETIEGTRELVGAWGHRLLAGASLWSAGGGDEAVLNRGGGPEIALVLLLSGRTRKQIGHEARHGC